MNQDKTSSLVDFINTYKSTISFWVVIILLLPFILFFISFNFHDLNTISNFGSLGSYLSGTTGFIAAIMTSISVIVLYYTLRITTKYNERQIKHNQTQTIITSFNLLLDSSIKIHESLKSNSRNPSTYKLVDSYHYTYQNITDAVLSYENYKLNKGKENLFQNYSTLIPFILDETYNDKIYFKSEKYLDEYLMSFFKDYYFQDEYENLSLLVYGMCEIISKLEITDTLRNTILILLHSNYHNDVIFYSLIYQSKYRNLSFNIYSFCKKPEEISEFFDSRVYSLTEDQSVAKVSQ